MHYVATSASARGRLIDLGRQVTDDDAARIVAATPLWSVREVYAHLVGTNADVLAGRLDGVTTDPWTQRQVDERAERSLGEILDEWEALSPDFDALLASLGDAVDPRLLIDQWTHEQDLRGTLGTAGGRNPELEQWAADILAGLLAHRITNRDLPPLRAAVGTTIHGTGDATLTVSAYEYCRGSLGRRSRSQIRTWDWRGVADPNPYIDAMLAFGIADHDITDAV